MAMICLHERVIFVCFLLKLGILHHLKLLNRSQWEQLWAHLSSCVNVWDVWWLFNFIDSETKLNIKDDKQHGSLF